MQGISLRNNCLHNKQDVNSYTGSSFARKDESILDYYKINMTHFAEGEEEGKKGAYFSPSQYLESTLTLLQFRKDMGQALEVEWQDPERKSEDCGSKPEP